MSDPLTPSVSIPLRQLRDHAPSFGPVDTPVKAFLKSFMLDRSGATALEYGLIAALISVAIITAVTAVGSKTNSMLFGSIIAVLP